MRTVQDKPLVCKHCGTEITNDLYIEKGAGIYACENCYFQDTYLDGITSQIEASYLATIEAFVTSLDAKEHEVGNHSLRVTQFAIIIGHAYGIRDRGLVDLYCGSLLHDIGKIGVPDAILLKKGPLSPAEQAVMQKHPEIGYKIISHIGYLANAAEIIRSHHEHFDGSGYPRGLKGEQIPVGARVFAVADALDALTVKRPYRDPITFEEAQKEIQAEAGGNLDPSVIDAFMKASNELRDVIGKIIVSAEHKT